MQIISNQTFSNRDVEIDGKSFVACRFENCALLCGATDEFAFDGKCTFGGTTTLSLVGGAALTAMALTALYAYGSGLRQLVEGVFEQIRHLPKMTPTVRDPKKELN